jgi:hypothetical protein
MGKCPIWGTPAELAGPITGDSFIIASDRVGGRYRISDTAMKEIKPASSAHKKLLTTWIYQQHRAGIEVPYVTSDVVREVKSHRPMRYSQRVNAVLLLYDSLGLPLQAQAVVRKDGVASNANGLLAATESENFEEVSTLLTHMEVEGYLYASGNSSAVSFSPTPRGWARIEELSAKQATGSQAFVAMWFDPSTEEAYSNGFFKAIYDCGYDPLRIDKKEHNNKIDDEIIAEIRRSRFLVADFTCGSFKANNKMHFVVRGGVYFEAGFAKGLDIPVIWTCRDTALGGLHFDTRQFAHIVWKDAANLYDQLKARIGATIGFGPLRR